MWSTRKQDPAGGEGGMVVPYGALILIAAGEPELPRLEQLVAVLRRAGALPVAVALPATQRGGLEQALGRVPAPGALAGVELVPVPAPDALAALQHGLRRLQGRCEGVLVTPADAPLFSVDTVRALTEKTAPSGADSARPVFRGRSGWPLYLVGDALAEAACYQGDGGLEGALQACSAPVYTAKTGTHRVDEAAARTGWRPLLKLQIARESAFLGPGSRQLLALVESTGSVRTASEAMGLSYSKAWKILNNLEGQVGFAVLHRQPGGRHGGETRLTPQGKALLEQFDRFVEESRAAVLRIFNKHYGDSP